MNYTNYPAPGKANLLAEIEESELLAEIYDQYEPSERRRPSVEDAMSSLLGLYGYTYSEYQYGCFMA